MQPVEDVGSHIHAVAAGAPQANASSATQTGVSSATGIVIDREALPRHYQSAKIAVPFIAVCASGKKITHGLVIQHSSATSGFATLASGGTGAPNKVGSTTTFNGRGVTYLDVNLRPAKRYLRVKQTKSFNSTASGANITVEAPVLVFGGANENPAAG